MQETIINHRRVIQVVHLQQLRAALLVELNHVYPGKLDCEALAVLTPDHGRRRVKRELYYLRELGFACSKSGARWRISAPGRDSLLGFIEAKGIMDPAMLDSIGED